MNETDFHFRSLMHMNSAEEPIGVTITEITKIAPGAGAYLERLWLRQIVRNFLGKLERHKRERLRKTLTGQNPSIPYTLKELLADMEEHRFSHDRVSGIRVKTSDETVLTDEDIEVIAA